MDIKQAKDYLNQDNLVSLSMNGFRESEINYLIKKKGYHLYQVRHHDNDTDQPETIEEKVIVNHYCDIILKRPIDFGKSDYVTLSDNDKEILKRYF